MLLEALFLGLSVGFSLSIGVGPVSMLTFQRSIHKGWLLGVASGLGIALADMIFASISRIGLVFVQDFIHQYQFWFQLGIGILLMAVGIFLFFSQTTREKHFGVDKNYFKNFLTAFLLTLANVLTLFTYGLVFARIIPSDIVGLTENIVLVLGVGLGSSTWWIFITYILSHFKISLEKIYILNRVFGSIIFLFGVASLVELWFF